jgi:hypothetical protein
LLSDPATRSNSHTIKSYNILQIAKRYPDAVFYPLQISKEGFALDSPESKVFVEQLENLCKSDLRDRFLRQLSYTSNPDAMFKDWQVEAVVSCGFFQCGSACWQLPFLEIE